MFQHFGKFWVQFYYVKNGINQHAVGNKHFHFPIITQILWRGQDFRKTLKKVCKCVRKKTEEAAGNKYSQRV